MSKLVEIQTANLRLSILMLAAEVGNGCVNEDILIRGVEAAGHWVSRDALLTQVEWLKEQGLVETNTVSQLVLVKITRRGADVAAGRSNVPGVDQPPIR
ncbi:MAG: ArsR family transcriptional regulator [Gammaproteobacteria bacterium]|nr:ArsR family transcriptional regulator [Gammaproteobacteria bacterium]